jgi:hypothetical protein
MTNKAAQANTWAAGTALDTVLELLQDEASDLDPADPDYAEDQADVATLGQIRDLLTGYIAATAREVGTADDLADLAEEQAETVVGYGMMAAPRSRRKSFTPYEFKLSETGDVTVAFSRFGVIDSDNDVTFAGAMPVGKAVPMSAYGHTSWDGELPIGKGVISEKGDLGILDGGFFMDTDQGRNGYNTVKAMADLQEWSYGYQPLPPSGPGKFDGQMVRELRKLDVFEVSPVLKGAGVGTGTLAIKNGALGSETPYGLHTSWIVEVVKAWADRTNGRADWRAKEGRVLSTANWSAIAGIVESLQAILASAEPGKAVRLRKATIAVLLADAARYGVSV